MSTTIAVIFDGLSLLKECRLEPWDRFERVHKPMFCEAELVHQHYEAMFQSAIDVLDRSFELPGDERCAAVRASLIYCRQDYEKVRDRVRQAELPALLRNRATDEEGKWFVALGVYLADLDPICDHIDRHTLVQMMDQEGNFWATPSSGALRDLYSVNNPDVAREQIEINLSRQRLKWQQVMKKFAEVKATCLR